jgi:hypothetical protein
MKARYWVLLGVIGGGIAYNCMRDDDPERQEVIDTNTHICMAKRYRDVAMALANLGIEVSFDDRVTNAKVLEVPAEDKDKALDALKSLQVKHPEYGIVIRTDVFPTYRRK